MQTTSAIPPTSSARGKLGYLGPVRDFKPAEFACAQGVLRAAKIRDAIAEALAAAPPLTDAQIDSLQSLLATGRTR